MKYPKHIILDVNRALTMFSSRYWIINFLFNKKQKKYFGTNLTLHRRFLYQIEFKILNKFFFEKRNKTLRYSHAHPIHFLNKELKKFYETFFQTKIKVKHRELFSKHIGKEIFDFKELSNQLFDIKLIKRLVKNFKNKPNVVMHKNDYLTRLFDIHFLRKERTYTKLKYSRVPQYDIVSGGSAALFAGFLGFLICEKFGFELVDSGDFYYLFMYIVFFIFSCRFYLKLINDLDEYWLPLSVKWLLTYYINILILFLNYFKYNRFFIKN